jgi:type IV secretory pathway protease TraF
MTKARLHHPSPGKTAIRQAQRGNYTHAVRILKRALASPNTPAKLAAKSRAIIASPIGKKALRLAKRHG